MCLSYRNTAYGCNQDTMHYMWGQLLVRMVRSSEACGVAYGVLF